MKKDKSRPRKFSKENLMNPGKAPRELQGLTETEQMLIAHVLPMIRVYVKPGGQTLYQFCTKRFRNC